MFEDVREGRVVLAYTSISQAVDYSDALLIVVTLLHLAISRPPNNGLYITQTDLNTLNGLSTG